MAKVYLNEEDIKMLKRLKQFANNEDETRLNNIISNNNNNRKHFNKVASEYKKRKRKQNKDFARSKTEITNRRNCYEK